MDPARKAYNAYAGYYDSFNSSYQFRRWTGRLLEAAESTGLQGPGRLLDLGCGTGLSFIPMLERGWTVTGCDISEEMLEIAGAKVIGDDNVELHACDMRRLPDFNHRFALVWAVNDAMNYLADTDELAAVLAGASRNLASGGRIVFDLNTMRTYSDFFTGDHDVATEFGTLRWRGITERSALRPGAFVEAKLEGDDPRARNHVHRQRHFGRSEVIGGIEAAGLECLALLGELGGDLEAGVDEHRHTKAVYVCGARMRA